MVLVVKTRSIAQTKNTVSATLIRGGFYLEGSLPLFYLRRVSYLTHIPLEQELAVILDHQNRDEPAQQN
jgi:hypothetical protein